MVDILCMDVLFMYVDMCMCACMMFIEMEVIKDKIDFRILFQEKKFSAATGIMNSTINLRMVYPFYL